ncbi:MAG: hemagglutinin repeat-containing protein, partial [Hydrogenophaga sp.]
MNHNHHRIVFNAARGQLMAVGETASSHTRSSASGEGPASAAKPKRWRMALLAVGSALLWPAQAQISADPAAPGTQRPTVLNAANGVPLVNITTPSAAGVSRNTYRQFDVNAQGAILNNSRTDVQTQLGGWVSGNPWLAAGPARVILNEVHSSQPSQLNGWVEVGGQRAEVIIANPAGINVNGGGFINASRATLTTGTAVMNAGALEGFRVQGGRVRIEGLGLDTSTTDHALILARAVEVNAGLWANALTVVTGANDVSTDAARITATAASGPAPAFALDVAALGGMYAGQIRLVGTEAGLGVNQAGLIDARGALTLDVNGWLSQSAGSRTYGDAVNIHAQGVRNQDGAVIAARDALSITAGEIHNTEGALLLSAGDMTLSASERIENRSAGVEALDGLSITTPVLVNANDHMTYTVVSDATTHHTVYYTPSGALDAADVAWSAVKPLEQAQTEYDVHQRAWLLPKTTRDARNFARVQQSADVGTQIQGASVALQAGQDITARAASVQAEGALVVSAGRDVSLAAGEASYQIDHGVYARSSGLLGSSSTETRTHNSRTDAVGTALGGTQVVVQSGQDISLTGSSAVADERIDIAAGRDVSLSAAQTRWGQDNFVEKKTRGVFSSGGGLTLGSQQHSTEQQTRGTGAAASTVGAIGGDMNITAGRAYAQTGSDVLAPDGDITVHAQSIAIKEARTTERSTSEEKFKQGGISIGLGGALVEAVQGVVQTVEAMGKTQDARMQALGTATAALQGYNAVQGLSAPASGGAASGAGVSVSISIGASQSASHTESQRNNAQGSTIVAGGDITLRAAGAGERSDILIQGSRVKAGQVATLSAEGDVNLLAATNTTQESSRSKNSSASIGFSVGAQTGVTVAASAGKGHGSGEETVHRNTRVEAGEQVLIDSEVNTTLRGAMVAAPNVQARVGGDLLIESLQDTSVFHEQSKQVGGSVTFGPAPGASISASKSSVNSDFTSVAEQSGLKAGDGGFQVRVRGNTELIGGAITSNQSAEENDLNKLETGTLSSRDLQNSSHASAKSSGVNLSSDMATQGTYGAAKAGIGNVLNNASESGSSSGQTRATVSGARVTITNEAEQKALTGQSAEEALASLNRDVHAAHTAAQKLDAQAMQQRVEAERAIKQEAFKAVTALTDEAYRSRMQQVPKLLKVE